MPWLLVGLAGLVLVLAALAAVGRLGEMPEPPVEDQWIGPVSSPQAGTGEWHDTPRDAPPPASLPDAG
ncbi:hypothetical protein GA0111570_101329 [Raineyella antarctica]|uniref:Uncharacterized protein n=1 Tax=Raineyella antarctica TaxID=1577474 RepID=A0A1G6GE77_9ACTN|nr:hypothetical protein GA0111570_101329 [Raineyella antarctica]